MSVFRVHVTRWILDGKRVRAGTEGAKKVRSRTRMWYADIPNHTKGKPDRKPLSTNKRIAQQMLGEELVRAERIRTGRFDPVAESRSIPLSDLLSDFEASIRTGRRSRRKPPTERSVALVLYRVRQVLGACAFAYATDITALKVQTYLSSLTMVGFSLPEKAVFTCKEVSELLGIARLTVGARCRRLGLPRTGQGPATRYPRETVLALSLHRSRGLGQSTVADYAKNMRRFTRWLVRQRRLEVDPLADLEVSRPESDHRHQRRALSQGEILDFLDATRSSERSVRGLSGSDRAVLYLTAMATGFRVGELATLKPANFLLTNTPPLVTLSESATKNDHGAMQPLPPEVVEILADYLATRNSASPVWPGGWTHIAAEMLRGDLSAAKIPYEVAGPDGPLYADFHALRHSFVAMLKRSGVTLSQAMRLARHSDPRLTIKVYGREDLDELSHSVARIGSHLIAGKVAESHGGNVSETV